MASELKELEYRFESNTAVDEDFIFRVLILITKNLEEINASLKILANHTKV